MLFAAPLALAAVSAFAQPSDVLVTVNGRPITRAEVVQRAWAEDGDKALNELVDQAVLDDALKSWRGKQTKKERQAAAADVAQRVKRIRAQFKDQGTFEANLKRSGLTEAGLRDQLQEQVDRERMIVAVDKLRVSPEEVSAFYAANKDKLGGPTEVHLRHIVVAGEQQAKDLALALNVGADFGKLAAGVSVDPATKDKGGDLGFVNPALLAPELGRVVSALKPGQVSEVVHMSDGFHIFQAVEVRQPPAPALKDVERQISQVLLAQKISQAAKGLVAELRAKAKIVPAPGVVGRGNAGAPAGD